MTRSLIVVAMLSSGCLVLPATKTKTRNAGTESSALVYGPTKSIALQTGSSQTDVRVSATSTHECKRQLFAVTEVTKTKGAKLGVDDPRGRALGVLAAPITIPISAIITSFIIAGSDAETTREKKLLGTETLACTQHARDQQLELQWSSGRVVRGTTDVNGVLVVAIPRDEPYAGDVEVRGAGTSTRIHYAQIRPAVSIARDAVATCSEQHQVTGATLKLTIDDRGQVTKLWLAPGADQLRACIATKLAGAVFPRALRDRTLVLPAPAT